MRRTRRATTQSRPQATSERGWHNGQLQILGADYYIPQWSPNSYQRHLRVVRISRRRRAVCTSAAALCAGRAVVGGGVQATKLWVKQPAGRARCRGCDSCTRHGGIVGAGTGRHQPPKYCSVSDSLEILYNVQYARQRRPEVIPSRGGSALRRVRSTRSGSAVQSRPTAQPCPGFILNHNPRLGHEVCTFGIVGR